MSDKIFLDSLETELIIGIFDWERKTKQKVIISVEMDCSLSRAGLSDNIADTVDYKNVSKSIIDLAEGSEFYLIETLAENIARLCLGTAGVTGVKVKVSKPGALRGWRDVSVTIERPVTGIRVFFGVGGNIDPENNIPLGLDLIRSRFEVIEISPVYRSEAWGVTENQPDYHNLAIEVRSQKDLFATRAESRWVEELAGRDRALDKFAPRPLDIDLLLFGDLEGDQNGCQFPHPQLLTQQFVYLPMLDIAPDIIVPGVGKALRDIAPAYDNPGLRIEKLP